MSVLVVGEDRQGSIGYVVDVRFRPATNVVVSVCQTTKRKEATVFPMDVAVTWVDALTRDFSHIKWSLSLTDVSNDKEAPATKASTPVDKHVDYYRGPEPESYDKRIARELKERQQAYNKHWQEKMKYYND